MILRTSSHQEVDHNALNEIKRVHQLIKDNGQQGDYGVQITFGELIPVSVTLENVEGSQKELQDLRMIQSMYPSTLKNMRY